MHEILIVEDDIHINEMLNELLSQNGYKTTAAFSGTEALLCLPRGFSLVLLDLMLPGKTGEQVLTEIRTANRDIPVMVLTARADKETTVELLRMGADDYLAKPFDNNELLARIAVQLRRVEGSNAETPAAALSYKGILLDADSFDAVAGGKRAGLSKREYEILYLLMSHPQKVFSKNNLYESIWGGEFLGDDNTINVHISHLRSKLAVLLPGEELIQTVWGIGYKMKA